MMAGSVPPVPVPPSALSPAKAPIAHDPARVAEGFESLFVSLLLKPLDSSPALFGNGAEGRTFGGLFREQLAQQLAAARPLGIADPIEAALRKRQAASLETPPPGKAQA